MWYSLSPIVDPYATLPLHEVCVTGLETSRIKHGDTKLKVFDYPTFTGGHRVVGMRAKPADDRSIGVIRNK